MEFELNVILDKEKEKEINSIKQQIAKISKLKIYDKKNIKEELHGPRLIFSCENKHSFIYLTTEIHCVYNKEILLAIYNVFTYLKDLSSNQERLSINVNYFAYSMTQNGFDISVKEKIKWECKFDGEIDIINLLMTIGSRRKEDYSFKQFKEKLDSNKKYEHILKNIEKYSKRKIPDIFSEPVIKKFGEIEIIMSSKCHYIDNLFKAFKHKNIDVTIIDKYEVNYDYINIDLSTTKLFKYTVIDEDENLFYILEDTISAGDDYASRLYFFTDEIEDDDLQKIVKLFDK